MAGGRGGVRPGSGPKPGNQNRRNMSINKELQVKTQAKWAELIDDETINNMEMLEMMIVLAKMEFKEGNRKDAFLYASGCAPFLHPRLSAIESKVTVDNNVENLTDDQISALLRMAKPSDNNRLQ
jgi:hypothetical protein